MRRKLLALVVFVALGVGAVAMSVGVLGAVGDSVSVRVTPDGRLGGGAQGGQAGATASGAPTLSASDVTVTH